MTPRQLTRCGEAEGDDVDMFDGPVVPALVALGFLWARSGPG